MDTRARVASLVILLLGALSLLALPACCQWPPWPPWPPTSKPTEVRVTPPHPAVWTPVSVGAYSEFSDSCQALVSVGYQWAGSNTIDLTVVLQDTHGAGYCALMITQTGGSVNLGALPTGVYLVRANVWMISRYGGDSALIGSASGTFEVGSPQPISIASAKLLPNQEPAKLSQKLVTCSGTDWFYISDGCGACGIKVTRPGHGFVPGMKANVTGLTHTGDNGERCISAITADPPDLTTSPLKPVLIQTRRLGGGNWHYSYSGSAGQRGVTDGFGLNTIGMFVRIVGRITYSQPGQFCYVDDGCSLYDGNSQHALGVRVLAPCTTRPLGPDLAVVDGVSTMVYLNGKYVSAIQP